MASGITAEYLREILHYDQQTGIFRWRVCCGNVSAGSVAGGINERGYRKITIRRVKYRASRLAWLYVHGVWPSNNIDHVNGNKEDDRLENLRDVTNSYNSQNLARAHSDSATGFLGVSYHHGKFRASIYVDGRKIDIGRYATSEAAGAAYVEAKLKLHAGVIPERFGRGAE